ncbi:MAG: hypothetical protein ACJAZF_003751 [Granulosicoccus sp.]
MVKTPARNLKRENRLGVDVGANDKLMLMDINTPTHDFEQLFGLSQSHGLTLSRTHVETRDGTVFKVQWLEERNQDETLVARYRSWTNQSQRPPYDKQTGWERFCVKGQLLEREVHYSKRDTNDWLH